MATEAPEYPEVLRACGLLESQPVRCVGDQDGPAGAQHLRHGARGALAEPPVAQQLAQKALFRPVGVGCGELVYSAVLLQDIYQAPVRELGDREARDPLEHRLVIEGGVEYGPYRR